jgi:hypothetical protein
MYYANALAEKYYKIFSAHLETQLLSDWTTTHVIGFIKQHIFESSVASLDGPQVLYLSLDFARLFWDFDENADGRVMGPPKWLSRKPSTDVTNSAPLRISISKQHGETLL